METRSAQRRRRTLWTVIGWCLTFLAFVVMFVALVWPTYKDAMFKPRKAHVERATKELRGILGSEVTAILIPAVNNDIGLIYVTAKLSEEQANRIRQSGKRRDDILRDVWEIAGTSTKLIFSLSSQPSRIMVGPNDGSFNDSRSEFRYREWLTMNRLPWSPE